MLRLLLATAFTFVAIAATAAQDPARPAPAVPAAQDPPQSRTSIQASIDAARDDATLAADLKAALLEVYGRALEFAKATETNTAAAGKFTEMKNGAPDLLVAVRAQLDAIGEPAKPAVATAPAAATQITDLEQELAKRQLELTTATGDSAAQEQEARKRAERRTSVPQTLVDRKKQLDALPEQIADAPDVDPRLLTARRVARLAERERLRSEIAALEAELAAYDAENDLLRARRDLAERKATKARAEVEAWQTALQQARTSAAQAATQQQAAKVAVTDARIVGLATGNARLASKHQEVNEIVAAAERETAAARDDLDRLTRDYADNQKRIQLVAGGSTETAGTLLRKRRLWLNEQTRTMLQRARNRGERVTDAQLRQFDVEEQRQQMNRMLPRDWLQRELGDVRFDDLPRDVREQAEALRRTREELLTGLLGDYVRLLASLEASDKIERDTAAQIEKYRAFLAEHVLGVRSSPPVWNVDLAAAAEAASAFVDPRAWLDTLSTLKNSVVGDIWPALLLLAIVTLLALRPWLRRRLAGFGEIAMRGSNVSYLPTALALADTVLIAAALPLLLWFVAWRLLVSPDATEFGKAMGAGARNTATLLAVVAFVRTLARPRGLGEAHFRWQAATLDVLRRNMPLLLPAAFPLVFVAGALEARANEAWVASLGNAALIAILLLLLVVVTRTLHPTTGLLGSAMPGRTSTLHRFRRLWFVVGVGTMLALLVMATLGYDYAVAQLARRLVATLTLVVAGVLVHAMVVRGLVLERRRIQIRQAQERLAAARQGDGGTTAGELPPLPALEDIDPQTLARRTQALLRGALTIAVVVAAYQIWVDLLPALGILRRIALWGDDSDPAHPVAITLADVLLSLSVLFLAIVAARNLPALLELLVLQRLKMQAGERNAVSTLARYFIIIIGVLLSFSTIGIGWSKVQWLVAAVSVGLGFGLQEIFANFVSGLILLFERPIRVGDIVSVGAVTGRVARIQIRATTIQDWERKELIVPNREFVTGHFVNWTLSDSVVRWTIPVGVAYGTDTQRALDLLAKIAAESTHVLREPKPEAVFVRFGDSTLELQLRVFVDMSALDYRWMTDLHQAIDRSFRDAGIQIAFPQHDVNLRAAGPLLELLHRGSESGLPTGVPGRD